VRLFLAVLVALLALAPAAHAADPTGPCTQAATFGMPEGEDHDHNEPSQHQGLYCRIKKLSFLPLTAGELDGGFSPDSKLGEMDVKGDIAAVAIQEPIGGAMFFDVSDSAHPKYLSTYLHAECGLGDNCGAYVDLSPDGKIAILSVQQTSGTPGPLAGGNGTIPGVALIDLSDPKKPALSQEYGTVSVQGVHTTRSHLHETGSAPGLYMYVIQNAVGVEIARVESTAAGPKAVRVANIPIPDATNVSNVHDTFIQTDPTDGKVYLYMAGGFTFGFRVYDVTNPAMPVHVASWDITPQCANDWYAHTMDVTTRNGRRIVTMPAEQFDFGAQSDANGETCGTQSGNGDLPGTMWIVDATDFTRLAGPSDDVPTTKQRSEATLITTWRTPSGMPSGQLTFSAHNQQIVGDLILLSHYHGGVYVLDAAGAFAGRDERPREVGWALPCDPQTRPTLDAGTFPHSRCDFWDAVFYKGHILAADIKGGLYSLTYDDAAGAAGGGGATAGGSAPCTDTAAPVSRLTRVKLGRGGADLRGTVTDAGCESRVTRVLVSIGLQKGRTCRYLTVRGRLGKPAKCSKPGFIPARGTTAFTLRTKGRLPKGRYRVGVRSLDYAGNVETARFRVFAGR
jgi:hypothetical protein